jgi:hypothetical protein
MSSYERISAEERQQRQDRIRALGRPGMTPPPTRSRQAPRRGDYAQPAPQPQPQSQPRPRPKASAPAKRPPPTPEQDIEYAEVGAEYPFVGALKRIAGNEKVRKTAFWLGKWALILDTSAALSYAVVENYGNEVPVVGHWIGSDKPDRSAMGFLGDIGTGYVIGAEIAWEAMP